MGLQDLGLARLADAFSSTFILALQISSPFIVYALIINLMVGIANKMVPQIPVYFISTPFVLAGGLLLALSHHRRGSASVHSWVSLPRINGDVAMKKKAG